MPAFPPIRAGGRGGRRLLPRGGWFRHRWPAAVLVMTAAALTVSAVHGSAPRQPLVAQSPARTVAAVQPAQEAAKALVRAPVRIADAAAVGLLRPGDRVDVLAASRVVASGVTVVAVPGQTGEPVAPTQPGGGGPLSGVTESGVGALVVLAVPRRTAAALSGAAATSPLAVALC